MKKVLSIVLIAAAAFGFYGGAVDITDVLDSKDYWEEQGRISDENLDKLEDGVNQLEENTDAYVDGKAQYQDGLAQYEQGKADYAAAPAKLADAEEQLAAAEKQLSDAKIQLAAAKTQLDDGATSIAGLEQLIAGCEGVVTAYETSLDGTNPGWKTIYAMLTTPDPTKGNLNATQQIIAGVATSKDSLKGLAPLLASDQQVAYVTALEGIAAAKAPESQAEYKTFAANVQTVKAGMEAAVKALEQIKAANAGLEAVTSCAILKASTDAQAAVGTALELGGANVPAQVKAAFKAIVAGQITDDATCAQVVGVAKTVYTGILTQVGNDTGIATISGTAESFGTWLAGYAGLTQGQAGIAGGIQQICQAFIGTDALKQGIIDNFGVAKGTLVIAAMTYYASDASPLFTDSFAKFQGTMEAENTGLIALLKQAGALLKATKSDAVSQYNAGYELYKAGVEQYNAGLEQYKAGLKEYEAGLADYEAAPAKLADAEVQLADGKAKLAQYEDGMEALKDGLKTLMETEAEGGLKSIAARIGEDEDFLSGNGLIDFEKALFGVEQGRAYSADSSDAITPELTNRAIAAGVGIGAAALALIAAILGLAKKKKGAGVCGILAAAAGAAAVFMTNAAGDTWTVLAGSTIGTMPVIAFGVVAAAAVIFGIAQFGGKEA